MRNFLSRPKRVKGRASLSAGIFVLFSVCWGLSLDALSDEEPADVMVFMNRADKNSYECEDGKPCGPWPETVSKILADAGLTHELFFVPWSRTMREARSHSNILVDTIARTTEREGEWTWIYPQLKRKYQLIARSGELPENFNLSDLASGEYVALCVEASVHCELLQEIGFSNDQIMRIADQGPATMVRLLTRKRVHFIISDYEYVAEQLANEGFDPALIEIVMTLEEKDVYLAAPSNFSPTLLKRIQDSLH